ncbi:DUF6461 domain-containing protein [Actinomadura algeriensis]|uniref:SUKH-3 immunity protein of toxin-antitoxin system n=1 Tax=Actinomadura algeriensis TaxID=1679523 RepID=A0ABR9JP55_9ACTN|nr:DUF6461 domain-containing protein [Actinomadura algeriensis]MBE1532141.1 hypothetical protein [Actinomadura algeriensis]
MSLDEICCVSFFRGLAPADVLRRFGPPGASVEQMTIGDLWGVADEYALETDGGDGGGYVGAVQANGWSVAIEPLGWYAILEEYYTAFSLGCEMVAVSRHDYAEDRFVYAAEGEAITVFDPFWPPRRWGSDPDRLSRAMRKVGLPTEPADARAAALSRVAPDRLAPSFALAAEITGVPFTHDLWKSPLFVGPVDQRLG